MSGQFPALFVATKPDMVIKSKHDLGFAPKQVLSAALSQHKTENVTMRSVKLQCKFQHICGLQICTLPIFILEIGLSNYHSSTMD